MSKKRYTVSYLKENGDKGLQDIWAYTVKQAEFLAYKFSRERITILTIMS